MAVNQGLLEKLFKLNQKGTDVKTEIVAGITTFVALAYIIFVNPNILTDAGIPKDAAVASTIYATVFATMLMGLWANFPVAVAPGMGLNAFFAYYVVAVMGLPWQVALGGVFFSGILFTILTFCGVLQGIIKSVPANLKASIGVGIGLFITFIGLQKAGIVVANPVTLVQVGKLSDPQPLLACIGLILTVVLMSRNIKGAMLISIVATTIVGMFVGVVTTPRDINDIMSFSLPNVAPTFLKLDLARAWEYGIFSIIFTFTIVELFDNMGTLIGLSRKAKLMNENGEIENLDKALATNAVSTCMSAILGTCTVTSYVESAAGIAEGGKTGLTSVVVAVLFIISMVFAPLIGIVPAFATAPVLIIIGSLMMSEVVNVKFDDISEALPAFLTIVMMPLTYSIGTGFAFGFISYTIIKVLTGKYKEINIFLWGITIAFIINFYLRLH